MIDSDQPRNAREEEATGVFPEAGSSPPSITCAAGPSVDVSPPPTTPTPPSVPGYELLGELGRGGMGVVYKARQIKAGRLVALKMILAGAHAGAGGLARFRTEAESAARLQHPNIVQIHEVDEHDGLPFFSLEFCAGGSLDQRLGGAPQRPLDAAELVELLARAMDYAHQCGVVHRDLKPANILLQKSAAVELTGMTEKARGSSSSVSSTASSASSLTHCIPKITDFGLAKKLDEAGQTVSGSIMGTPSYMAPEQAAGKVHEVGPSADVYALGAILYECLTGRPPFKGVTMLDTLVMVRSQEPVPPTQLQPAVPRDLETICLKCLQKDRAKRYVSALDLADDLARFARGEPILARPVGRLERAWRWCGRNRRLAAALAAVVVLLIGATAVSITAAVRINAAKVASERDAERAREGLKIAGAALDAAVNKITENPRLRDRGFFALRKELLGSVLPFYEQLAGLESDDPDLEAERAHAFGKLGHIRWWMGENDQALAAYRKMDAVFVSLIARYPDRERYRYSAALSLSALATLLDETASDEDGWAALDRSEKLTEQLVAEFGKADYYDLLLTILLNRAKRLVFSGRRDECLDTLARAEKLQGEAAKLFPGHRAFRIQLSNIHTSRGLCLSDLKRRDEAERSYRLAVDIIRPIAERPSASQAERHQLGSALTNLGTQLQKPEDARDVYEQARKVYLQLCAESPDVPTYRQWLSGACHNLASAYDGLGDKATATKWRRESLAIFEKLASEFPQLSVYTENLGMSYGTMGARELEKGNVTLALEWFRKSTEILEPLLSDSGPVRLRQQLALSHRGTARCLMEQKRYAETIRACDRALTLDDGDKRKELLHARDMSIRMIRQESVPALRLARAGDHVQAVAAVEALVKGPNDHPEMDFNAACVYGICAAKIEATDAKLAKQYGDRAVALLLKARAGGLFDDPKMVKQLRIDGDLVPLRGREDYKKLESELTAGRNRE